MVAVNVGTNDGRSLNTHIVEGAGDCAGSNGSGVARCDSDEDGVDVGCADEEDGEGVAGPMG